MNSLLMFVENEKKIENEQKGVDVDDKNWLSEQRYCFVLKYFHSLEESNFEFSNGKQFEDLWLQFMFNVTGAFLLSYKV